jgi:Chalcone isomerase-like
MQMHTLKAIVLCGLLALSSAPAAWADNHGAAAQPEVTQALPGSQLVGGGRLTVWGFQVYDARLFAAPGFQVARYASQPLALELNYLRSLKGADIAKRSLEEIGRQGPVSEVQSRQWLAEMLRLFPDVSKGERITGVHQPGVGAKFYVNGKLAGEVRDAEFSQRFFGIWLSPQTSEPGLRAELLKGSGS